METVCFSKTLAPTYKSALHHNPEEQHCHHRLHLRENLTPVKKFLFNVLKSVIDVGVTLGRAGRPSTTQHASYEKSLYQR
jgi:hypothetical protein